MKISPLEIRQKTFEKNFRGYDKEEVDAFLLSLSQEWERVMDDSKELKIRLQNSEREVQKLREVENTLYKTLKTAEDTGANIVEQANKSAELLMKESQINAESILNEARTRSKNMLEEAEEKAKNALYQAQNKLNDIIVEIKSLENQKQNLVHDLRQFAQTILDKANHISATNQGDYTRLLYKDLSPATPAIAVQKETVKELPAQKEPAQKEEVAVEKEEPKPEPVAIAAPVAHEKETVAIPEPSKPALSFFDQI